MMESSEEQTGADGRITRREILRRSALLAAGVGVGAPVALHFARGSDDDPTGLSRLPGTEADPNAVEEPAPTARPAAEADDEYRALVCVFLFGGNDHNATFVPYDDESYGVYRRVRAELAPDRGAVHPLGAPDESGRELAFRPRVGCAAVDLRDR